MQLFIYIKKIAFFCAAAGLTLALFACGERAETTVSEKPQTKKVKSVNVSPVNALPPRGSVEYVGVLSAHRKVNVSCETGGTIEKLYFEKGDKVKKGQLLAEINTTSMQLQVRQAKAARDAARIQLEKMKKGSRPEEILMAAAALREAEAASEEAERNFVRIKGLYGIQAVSDSDYDSAKRSVDMTREKVESARQHLALAKEGPRIEDRKTAVANLKQAEAVLAIAKDHLKKSRLHAPCDGIIAFREVEEGEVLVIPPGITITQIVDLDRLKIKISVGEKDIHLVEKDKRFFFTVDAIPEEAFQCRFFFRSPTANPVTRAFPVELIVEEPDERMADGLTARVKFPIINEKKIIKVPSAWLSEENGKIGLYVVKEGKAQFKTISLGAYYDQRVEILSGLTEQELVITNPAGIRTGDTVRY